MDAQATRPAARTKGRAARRSGERLIGLFLDKLPAGRRVSQAKLAEGDQPPSVVDDPCFAFI